MIVADTAWAWSLAVVLIVANLMAVALVLLQLPGTWIMLALTALFAWWRWDEPRPSIGLWTLGVALALALLAELVEFVAGAIGSRTAGGSKRGAFGSMVGGVIGAIVGTFAIPVPIVGTLIGACLGAACGSMLGDIAAGREPQAVWKAGAGAAVGKLVGTVTKVGIALMMWLIIAIGTIV
jgi:uncharacterized protein YqgC (DUF456 family)